MSDNSKDKTKLKNGINGQFIGTINGIVFQKNGVIRKIKYKPKRKRRKWYEINQKIDQYYFDSENEFARIEKRIWRFNWRNQTSNWKNSWDLELIIIVLIIV